MTDCPSVLNTGVRKWNNSNAVIFKVMILVSGALLICTGCGRPQSRLVGRWQMQATNDLHEEMVGESMQDRAEDAGLTVEGHTIGSKDNDSDGEDFVAARMEVQFASGGLLRTTHIMLNKPYEKTGTWRVVSETDSTMQLRCELQGEQIDTLVTFEDQDTIRMIPPNFDVLGKEHTFRRAK